MDSNENNQPFRLSFEVKELLKTLKDSKVGQVFSYEDMGKITMCDVHYKKNHVLASARRILARDHGVSFRAVPNIGIKRMSDEEIISSSKNRFGQINRMTRREIIKLASVDFEKLNRDSQMEHNLNISVYGALAMMTTPKNMAGVRNRIANSSSRVAISETLECFKNSV